jgi:hypothetical protein
MSELRGYITGYINGKKQAITDPIVEFIGEKYFVILENGEIIETDNDIILNQAEIRFVFIFLIINYKRFQNHYKTSLSPIIITQDLNTAEKILNIDNWKFVISCQEIGGGPAVFQVDVSNEKLKYVNVIRFSINKILDVLNLLMILSKCTTKTEAEYLLHLSEEKERINTLIHSINWHKAELKAKELEIENYKKLLDGRT